MEERKKGWKADEAELKKGKNRRKETVQEKERFVTRNFINILKRLESMLFVVELRTEHT